MLPYFELPLFFFDQSRFRQALTDKPPITVFKDALNAADKQFDVRFKEGEDIRNLVYERALLNDCMLHYAWHQFNWQGHVNLIAVGGYGRAELHPKSDIDLLLLIETEKDADQNADSIQQFLTFLWDIGLDIGHSVRTLDQCSQIAKEDITVATNLLESRSLQGNNHLRVEMLKRTGPDNMWPAEDFFLAKLEEQRARHSKYKDTEYNLEPNVKNAPGGLRDIQMISWVAKRFFGVRTLRQLQGKGFFTEEEFGILLSGEDFLWKVRYGLHMITGRAEERLLFDHQRELARLFGYQDTDESLAVEQFMHWYYRIVQALRELNDVLLQFLNEAILQIKQHKSVTPINERFQLRGHNIEAAHIKIFEEDPSALLEIFVLMGQNANIDGARASTIRLIRENRYLIDDDFRQNPKNTALFMELCRTADNLAEQLRRMKRYGVLGRYLPEFGQVTGQMQHDLFHIYTVDAHTLHVVQNMCHFSEPGAEEKFPIAAHIMKRINKPELLYIAGLYHDIAKGRGGNHATLGAVDAEDFGVRHQLTPRETRLISWLVEKHLLMSSVSQKQDLSEPEVIHNFALEMGDQLHLDYLYALTVADICATNPDLWTTWRASLMRQLYMETKRALRRGLENTVDKQEMIEESQEAAIHKLSHHGLEEADIRKVWGDMGEDYFLRESYHDIAWHTEAILQHQASEHPEQPLILIKETDNREHEGATQIFVRVKQSNSIFAAVATTLDQLQLNIQDARIYDAPKGYTIDTYYVLNEDGEPIGDDPSHIEKIRQELLEELSIANDTTDIVCRRTSRRLKHFSMPTRTSIRNDIVLDVTVLEVITPDRPGLLARIGHIFLEYGVLLQNARIATLGERVEDMFFITDMNGEPLSDATFCERLQRAICEQLDEQIDQQKSLV